MDSLFLDTSIRASMDPVALIKRYYNEDEKAFRILMGHGQQVARKALTVARNLSGYCPDQAFIWEAAMLHDIGMIRTRAHGIFCFGDEPYICHGVIGREILEAEGFPRHARVCECHVGVGISEADIQSQRLPLPRRAMIPQTIEEQLICYADKFFSKNGHGVSDETILPPAQEKSIHQIVKELTCFGNDKPIHFLSWVRQFEPNQWESYLRENPIKI
jgi:uncharacterized protein